jgi:hypothetical protein
LESHITETSAESDESAARATAKAAYETIQEARRALLVAHQDCFAPVPVPTMGDGHLTIARSDDLADLPNDTALTTPDGLYVKHWKWWRGAYEKITHEEMWERILGGYADGPLDGDFLLVPRGALKL